MKKTVKNYFIYLKTYYTLVKFTFNFCCSFMFTGHNFKTLKCMYKFFLQFLKENVTYLIICIFTIMKQTEITVDLKIFS